MKKLTTISAMVLACAGAYAQGTVQYGNTAAARVSSAPAPGGTKTTLLSTSGVDIEMFYQPNVGGLAPAGITSSGVLGNWLPTAITGIISLGGGGIFSGPNQTLSTATGGGNVWLDIVGWNNNGTATTLAIAVGGGANGATLFGSSGVFSNATGNPAPTDGSQPTLPSSISANFAASTGGTYGGGAGNGLVLTPVPEPTTMALGALGVASLLAFRRKK